MKSLGEIKSMLESELSDCLDNIESIDGDYYNQGMGDTSFLLAGFLESLLKEQFNDWDSERWIDDSLLQKIELTNGMLSIWGVMIWGLLDTTEQWVDPFYFETEVKDGKVDISSYTFLFCDLNNPEISYEEFRENRSYWSEQYYRDNSWSPSEKNWNYIISKRSS